MAIIDALEKAGAKMKKSENQIEISKSEAESF